MKNLRILFFIMALGSVAVFAYSLNHRYAGAASKTSLPKSKNVISYDTAVVNRLHKVSNWLNVDRPECLISGTIKIIQMADSAESGQMKYLFSKNGSKSCYIYGEGELIVDGDLVFNIDHHLKRVLFTKKQFGSEFGQQNRFLDTKALIDAYKKAHYKLKTYKSGSKQTISLLNDEHLSCTEYSVTFDTTSLKPEKLFVRMPNLEFLNDKSKDNILVIYLNQLSNSSQIQRYNRSESIVTSQGNIRLEGLLKDYTLKQL